MTTDFYQAIFYSLIIYVLLLVLSRLMGKKFIAQLTFFDFITAITIGTISGSFITAEVKGAYLLLSPVVFAIAVITTGFISLKSVPARKFIEGEPVIAIQNGKILEKNLGKMRLNIDNLMMMLREKKVFELSEVEFAVLEPSGKLSVLKKSQNLPLTPSDVNIETKYKGMSSEIIRDGKIVEQNLRQNNLTHQWLYNQLLAKGVRDLNDVFLASLSTDGILYFDLKNDKLDYVQEVDDDQ
ncbi:DUF421 domain-containing protein [Metallumcola ferriviriculae]|uniref:DUF421 domain-containing protein n=1 Tax=Metallumcola ferriviriculae TaxID=3039180 RepID=A0AAU0UW73_9FIRM|nr:DUF421 domain-containing protein [Desulfitibacteraceae bacterium MK1]